MPSSSRRHGYILDFDAGWPLSGTTPPPADPPALTLSPSSSNEKLDSIAPSTPSTERFAAPRPSTPSTERYVAPTEMINSSPLMLPGFHFSTTDESVDPAEFHRTAAQLLSGRTSKHDSGIDANTSGRNRSRQLHCDLGRDPSGRYCCSCSKSYATPLKLREHIAMCAGTTQYPCPTCDKLFETKQQMDHHVMIRHNNNKETCPECGQKFPASYLPKHLARGRGGCDGMVRLATEPLPEIDSSYQHSAQTSPSQHFWIYDGDLSWQQSSSPPARDSKVELTYDNIAEQTRAYVQRLLRRPSLRPNMESCDLCGDLFSKEGDALAQHIGEHSLDFAEKRHRCDDCRIYFANEKDLDRHLQSANLNHHCGFTFKHNSGTCSGHHPPLYYKSAITNDHDLMQRHLWAWEQSQLRLHRVTVARLLAERLTSTKQRHMTVQDARRTYVSLLPHVSVASGPRDSLRSESGWANDRRESEAVQLETHFQKVLADAYPEEYSQTLEKIQEANALLEVRPESTTLPKGPNIRVPVNKSWKRKSLYDMAKKVVPGVEEVKESSHKRGASGPIAFLKQQASKEFSRPNSLQTPSVVVSSAA